MEAIAWTAIGLLGAAVIGSFGGFFYLGSRIDSLGARLDGRIDAFAARLDGRIDSQEARIDRLTEQIADLTAAVRDLTGRFDVHLERHPG